MERGLRQPIEIEAFRIGASPKGYTSIASRPRHAEAFNSLKSHPHKAE
jgi:hypothetical protein